MRNPRPRFIMVTFALAAAIVIRPSHAAALQQAAEPDAVAARGAAADSLFAAGEYAAAREAYVEVAAAWPDSISVTYRLGRIRVVTGRPTELGDEQREVAADRGPADYGTFRDRLERAGP